MTLIIAGFGQANYNSARFFGNVSQTWLHVRRRFSSDLPREGQGRIPVLHIPLIHFPKLVTVSYIGTSFAFDARDNTVSSGSEQYTTAAPLWGGAVRRNIHENSTRYLNVQD